ncbi:hypothetical protein V1511DRAFT_463124 [Dipodascopsis uninucleata]
MDEKGRKIIVWTGATSGLGCFAVASLLESAIDVYRKGQTHHRRRSRGSDSNILSHRLSISSKSSSSSSDECPRVHLILALRDPSSENTIFSLQYFRELAARSDSIVEGIPCDLSCFKSVRNFTEKITARYESISSVILGASITTWGPPTYTDDRYELGIEVNHLSQWLLVALLSNNIRDRVVFVGSSGYKSADIKNVIEHSKRKSSLPQHSGILYSTAKAVQALCISHWADYFRDTNVDVILCTPGFVPNKVLKRHLAQNHLSMIDSVLTKVFSRSPDRAADVIVFAAMSPSLCGQSSICINKNMKIEDLNFRGLQSDVRNFLPEQLMKDSRKNNERARRDMLLSNINADNLSLPQSETKTSNIIAVLQRHDNSDHHIEKIALWNWSCLAVKMFEFCLPDIE